MSKKNCLLTVLVVVLAVCFCALAACDNGGNDSSTLTLSKTELTVNLNGTGTVTATTSAAGTIEWSVDDSSVLQITAIGKICSLKGLKVGTATVTAKLGDQTATCTVQVKEAETIEIKQNGAAVIEATVEQGSTVTFTAAGSQGSEITEWVSDDESIATVENGVVTGVFPGTATITAKAGSSLTASVQVTVTAKEGTTAYNMLFSSETGTNVYNEKTGSYNDPSMPTIDDNTFYYWASRDGWNGGVDLETMRFENQGSDFKDGKLSISYVCSWNPGHWASVQVFFRNTSLEEGATYKLSCQIESDVEGYVTFCDSIVLLTKGTNTYEIYLVYSGGASAFKLIMGVDSDDYPDSDPNGTLGSCVEEANLVITNITWTKDSPEQLQAPSFSLDENNIVTITDPNTAGVGSYKALFYQNDVQVGSAVVENGKTLPTNTLEKGTYTVKIQAIGESKHYLDSAVSATPQEIIVEAGASYVLAETSASGALAAPGTWTYYRNWYVEVTSATYAADVVSITFSNNAGTWTDTQLFYKNPTLTSGKAYKLTFDANVENDDGGRVTVNGTVITLTQGKGTYEVTYTETSDCSIAIVFGVYPEDNNQEIQAATVTISNVSWEETTITPVTPSGDGISFGENGAGKVALTTPDNWYYWNDQNWANSSVEVSDASFENGVVSITYNVTSGSCDYGLQLFYDYSTNVVGANYKLTMNVTSTAAITMVVNGTTYNLEANKTTAVEVTAAEPAEEQYAGASISIQVPVSAGDGATITLSNISMTYVDAGSSSGGSDTPVTPDIEKTYGAAVAITPADGTLTNGGEETAVANADTWYEWHVQDATWNCGPVVTLTQGTAANGTITVEWSATGAYWFGMQLFYKASSHTTGKYYRYTMKINSTVAGDITVNGTVCTLAVGDNTVTVESAETANASISIQFGNNSASTTAQGTFVISDITCAEENGTSDSGSSTENGSSTSGSDSGSSSTSGTTVTASTITEVTYVEHPATNWFEFEFSKDDALASSYATIKESLAEVSINGTKTSAFNMYAYGDAGAYRLQVQVGTRENKEYTFVLLDSDGNALALFSYTYSA